jgi:uncharacterized protein (TIGR02599 family)
MKRLLISGRSAAFTLTEVLVSSALIVGIMALMLTTVDQTRRTISNTTSRVSQFQSARVAFESMTRALGQATLNTYYDLDRSGDAQQNPFGYRRQSDLHFICGQAYRDTLVGGQGGQDPTPRDSAHFPGHAVFFQAPLGVTAEEISETKQDRTYRGLTNLLSVVGYYVKWGEDENRPTFMGANEKFAPKRNRFRLMQVQQPAETVMVYADINYTELLVARPNQSALSASPGKGYTGPTDWIHVALGIKDLPNTFKDTKNTKRMNYSRVLAENVVALIIVPKVPTRDRSSPSRLDDLTDTYEYDTCPEPAFQSQKRQFNPDSSADMRLTKLDDILNAKQLKQLHQLPPILQVTMIAIDEESGTKLADHSDEPPDWTGGRFQQLSTEQKFMDELGDPADPKTDSLVYAIGNPDRRFATPPMKYRVFTTDVLLRGSKWSK